MLKIRSVLVATDLGENPAEVLSAAAALAAAAGAELHVLHALEADSLYPAAGWDLLQMQRRTHDARLQLEDWASRNLPANVERYSVHVAADRAHAAILRRAEEVGAELIVLGPHRPRAVGDRMLGTTADRVLSTSRVPCLILHAPLLPPLRRVAVPTDLSFQSEEAVEVALLWSSGLGARGGAAPAAEVRVLHVAHPPREWEANGLVRSRIETELAEQVAAARERAGALDVAVTREVRSGLDPAEEILSFVQQTGAELLVMGTHGNGALVRMLIGSVSSAVARRASIPVLLVPPGTRVVREEDRRREAAATTGD